MSIENMKEAGRYQAITRNPDFPVCGQVANEIIARYEKGVKVEKTSFKTSVNLVKYRAAKDALSEFFDILDNRANGKG